jgi:hypothetical protein
MELRKFIATTIREYLNESVIYLSDKIRDIYNKEKNKGASELEYSKLIKFGLKYDDNFIEQLNDNERKIWLQLQDDDFYNNPITLPIVKIPIEKIYFSQNDININKIENENHKKGLPIFIKKNSKIYIISGNHRLFNQLIKKSKDIISGYIKNFDN